MGKKVSPRAIRIGIVKGWDSKWHATKKTFRANFLEDIRVRKFLKEKLKDFSLSTIEIDRDSKSAKITLHTAKPGAIIGRTGDNLKALTEELLKKFGTHFRIEVQEVPNPDKDATIIAGSIAMQIERRLPYRRVCKMVIDRAKDSGAKGIKIKISGRLNGVDIARQETFNFGRIPLHTLRANIDYDTAEANTMYGVLGVKVWVFHGLVFKGE